MYLKKKNKRFFVLALIKQEPLRLKKSLNDLNFKLGMIKAKEK